MAESKIVPSLFGLTPEMYGEQQRVGALQEGITLAQLDPAARGAAMTYAGGRGLAGAIAGAMGVEDPQLKMISTRNAIAQQIDQTDPESILKGAQMLAQAGDQQGAMALAQYARQAQGEMALTQQRRAAEQSSLATAAKTQLSIKQEEQLREELSKLGPDATQEQILGVVTKYGSPDKVLASLQGSADRQLANQARVDAAKVAADARIDAAREAGATRVQIAQMQADARRDIAQMAQSFKQSQAEQPLSSKELQKREASFPQATSAIKSFETKSDSFVKDIEKLRDHPGLPEITGFAAGRLPGITANGRAAQALYDKIVAKGGFQALQDLRDASKTGGALGNVSNQEGKQLTASFGAIDRRQDVKDVQEALNQAIGDIQGSKTRLKEAYDMTYSYKAEQPKKSMSSEDEQALNWANSNPKDPRAAQIKNRLGVK
jgi:hypothetical protein